MGTLSTTVNGRTCQAWASNTPHAPNSAASNDASYPDGSRAAARNYCRNPDWWPEGVWCYTTDPNKRWEECSVPFCSGRESSHIFDFKLFAFLGRPMIVERSHVLPLNFIDIQTLMSHTADRRFGARHSIYPWFGPMCDRKRIINFVDFFLNGVKCQRANNTS